MFCYISILVFQPPSNDWICCMIWAPFTYKFFKIYFKKNLKFSIKFFLPRFALPVTPVRPIGFKGLPLSGSMQQLGFVKLLLSKPSKTPCQFFISLLNDFTIHFKLSLFQDFQLFVTQHQDDQHKLAQPKFLHLYIQSDRRKRVVLPIYSHRHAQTASEMQVKNILTNRIISINFSQKNSLTRRI